MTAWGMLFWGMVPRQSSSYGCFSTDKAELCIAVGKSEIGFSNKDAI